MLLVLTADQLSRSFGSLHYEAPWPSVQLPARMPEAFFCSIAIRTIGDGKRRRMEKRAEVRNKHLYDRRNHERSWRAKNVIKADRCPTYRKPQHSRSSTWTISRPPDRVSLLGSPTRIGFIALSMSTSRYSPVFFVRDGNNHPSFYCFSLLFDVCPYILIIEAEKFSLRSSPTLH